ncbi:MAG: hypothetical protein EBW21_00910 [Actinobacteria bacterium]|nr:hypothetical protein [Actinomycetota bacterium]
MSKGFDRMAEEPKKTRKRAVKKSPSAAKESGANAKEGKEKKGKAGVLKKLIKIPTRMTIAAVVADAVAVAAAVLNVRSAQNRALKSAKKPKSNHPRAVKSFLRNVAADVDLAERTSRRVKPLKKMALSL